jgi:hypothetical protein
VSLSHADPSNMPEPVEPVSDERLRETFGDYINQAIVKLCNIDNLVTIAEASDRRDKRGRLYRLRLRRHLSVEFQAAITKHDPSLALSLGAMLPTNGPVQPSRNGSASPSANGAPTQNGIRPACGVAQPAVSNYGGVIITGPSIPMPLIEHR